MLKLVNFVNLNILFTSLTSCPSVQKSSLPCCCRHVAMKFWCQSSIKFDRLRSFLVIHRVFTIIPPFFGGVQVRSSSIKFDQVRSSSIEFDTVQLSPFLLYECLPTPHRLGRTLKASNEPPRISPQRSMAAGRTVINSFQDVKDQLSSSDFGFEIPGEPGRNGQKVVLRKR